MRSRGPGPVRNALIFLCDPVEAGLQVFWVSPLTHRQAGLFGVQTAPREPTHVLNLQLFVISRLFVPTWGWAELDFKLGMVLSVPSSLRDSR